MCLCYVLKLYCGVRRKLKDLTRGLQQTDRKKSGSGEYMNAEVETHVTRNNRVDLDNIQQRNQNEHGDRLSLHSNDSDIVIFKKGACSNLGYEE